MINRVTEDQFTYSISKGFYNHESHINKNKNLREPFGRSRFALERE